MINTVEAIRESGTANSRDSVPQTITPSAIVRRIAMPRSILSAIALCLTVSLVAAIAHAQDMAPGEEKTAADTTFLSLDRTVASPAPYLVIGMVDRSDTASYGSLASLQEEATIPSARDTITREVGPAASASRTETIESRPLQLSSLLEPTRETRGLSDIQAESTSSRDTIQRSPEQTGAGTYGLMDDRSVPGSFLYRYQGTDAVSEQWMADNESFSQEIDQAPRPLLQVGFGDWRLPVMLSSAPVAR